MEDNLTLDTALESADKDIKRLNALPFLFDDPDDEDEEDEQ